MLENMRTQRANPIHEFFEAQPLFFVGRSKVANVNFAGFRQLFVRSHTRVKAGKDLNGDPFT